MAKKQVITGIDVGTTKICSVIAQRNDGSLQVVGIGSAPSRGLKKGIVVNLSETISSIRQSLELAAEQAQTETGSAFISVGGAYLHGRNEEGETDVRGRNGEVCAEDIDRVVSDARQIAVPENFEIIHVLTQDFTLDGQSGIEDPLGLKGQLLAVKLHLVLNNSAVVQNIVHAIHKSDIVVDGVVMQQLASAEAVLTPDEKELGALLIDIGGGTTDVAVYKQGTIWHSEVLPMGGSLFTKDIAIGFKAPIAEAEIVKKQAGSVFPESVPGEEVVELSEVGSGRSRTVPRIELCRMIQARCDELLKAILTVARKAGVDSNLIAGAVFTGGGSLLDGLVQRSEQALRMPVRLGYPTNSVRSDSEICHPSYSTALGLLLYAGNVRDRARDPSKSNPFARLGRTSRFRKRFLELIG